MGYIDDFLVVLKNNLKCNNLKCNNLKCNNLNVII